MILLSYGTRPEYIKILPLIDEFKRQNISFKVLFTGQHQDIAKFDYDYKIDIFDKNCRLDSVVNSITDNHIFLIKDENPDLKYVLVQGDTTSAFAVALSAFHNNIKVIHLEAGLRTYDNKNPHPEEQNRRLISQITDIHLCPTENNKLNIINEKVSGDIYVTGNTVLDGLQKIKPTHDNIVLVTLHRRENHAIMDKWFMVLNDIAKENDNLQFILPIHPNPNVKKHQHLLTNVTVIEPLLRDSLINLMSKSRFIITDSGGIQEEGTYMNKRIIVCRQITERPESILTGHSILCKSPENLKSLCDIVKNNYMIEAECPYGKGNSAKIIAEILQKYIK